MIRIFFYTLPVGWKFSPFTAKTAAGRIKNYTLRDRSGVARFSDFIFNILKLLFI